MGSVVPYTNKIALVRHQLLAPQVVAMFWFKKQEKIALDAAVRAAGKPATALVVERAVLREHVFPPTATHFGGNPYFEMGDTWPTLAEDERPYDFVCQVNFKDCPERPDVPFDLFTVFLCWDLIENEMGDAERGCIVRTYRDAAPSKAIPITRPAPLVPDDYRVRPCAVRAKTFMTYPSWSMVPFPAIAEAASKFRNPVAAFHASLKRLGFWNDFRSRLGGFPTWVHDNTLDHNDLVFLAQIGFEPTANNCIGDAAPIYIAVSASDPTRIETDAFQSF